MPGHLLGHFQPAAVLETMRRHRAEGMTLRAVARQLNSLGCAHGAAHIGASAQVFGTGRFCRLSLQNIPIGL
jgi:hypothetical protein